jgi:hypothetical protein
MMTNLKERKVTKLTLDYRKNNEKVAKFYQKMAAIVKDHFEQPISIKTKEAGQYIRLPVESWKMIN